MDKHDDTVQPEDEHQVGQRPGYVDINGRLAGVIAGQISEQVTANLLSALQMSMLSCESRLIQEINKAIAARPRELDTMSSVSGPTSERRFPPRPSRAGTGRSTPREDFPAELPSWVKKSIKKSGGIPSMKDLENCHADYLMEELKSTHRNREKLVTKRKPPADADDSRGSAHESRRDGISRSQSGRSFASSTTHRSPRRSSPSRAQAMGPPGSPPPDGPPLRLPPLPLIGAGVPLHLVAGTNRQEDERHTPTSIVERPSFSSDAGPQPELELEDVFTRQKTPQSIREESNHEMQAPGSNEAEQADRGPSRSGSPGHARHARPRDSFEDDSELGLGIQEPGEDQPEQPRQTRRSRFESIARRVLLGRSTPTSQEAMDDIRPGEAPVSYLARQILNNPRNTRSTSSVTGTRNFNRIVPGDLSMHSGHEQRPTFDGDSHTLQAIRSLASERSVVTVRSERSGPSTRADRDSSKLRVWGLWPSYISSKSTGSAADPPERGPRERLTLAGWLAVLCPLFFFGVIPAALAFCIVLFSLGQFVDVVVCHQSQRVDTTTVFMCLLDLAVSIGGFLSFILLPRLSNCDVVHHIGVLLNGNVQRTALLRNWISASRLRLWSHVGLWMLCGAARAMAERDIYAHNQYWWPAPAVSPAVMFYLRPLAFMISSFLFLLTVYCLDHMSFVMTMVVDAFLFRCSHMDLPNEVLMGEWNNMQAQFRRATGFSELSIVTTFLVVSLVMVSGVILPLQSADKDVRTLWVLAVASPLAVSTGRFFTKAAEVTEKCRRAPALVNSLPMAKEMDERFYIVHFISQSYAGFFIQEVPINGTMVMKLGHVGFLAVFAVISHLLSK